jgi:zeaxanthin glucosyltransferase
MTIKMKNVLFIMFPVPSHYISCLPLANELKESGYNVCFSIPFQNEKLQQLIKSHNFEYKEIHYCSENLITSFTLFLSFMINSLMKPHDLTTRYRQWFNGILSVRNVNKEIDPAMIFIDEHLNYFYLALYEVKDKITIVNTKLSTRKSRGVPPLNSSYIPSDKFYAKLYCEILWLFHLIPLRTAELISWLAFLGKNENFFFKRLARKMNKSLSEIFTKQNAFYWGIHSAGVMILSSERLEFKTKRKVANEQYKLLPHNRIDHAYWTPGYIEVKSLAFDKKEKRGVKIIYCALGSISSIDYNNSIMILSKILAVTKRNRNWFLIMSQGNVTAGFESSENVAVFNYVPQLDVLKFCDLMITHGGLTSITECLQNKVPMLVYPINKKGDTTGNAARVHANGFGLRGDIAKDSIDDIERKLNLLLTDTR